MRVLLVIDSFDREFLAVRLLAAALDRHGMVTRICSRPVLGMTYNRFRPDVVVLPKTHKIPELEAIHRSSVVLLAQAESFVGSEDSFNYLSGNLKKEFIDVVCCWGPFDYDFYLHSGFFTREQAFVTGHPIIESWYLAPERGARQKAPVVGLTTSLRAFTHKANGPHPNPIASIIGIEEVGDSGYFVPPYHAEDWVAFEAAWIRVIYQLVKENPDIRFSLRPHPLENPVHYKVFEKFTNLAVDPHGHIAEWLGTIDVMCSMFSGSMLDGYFRHLPVVSIRNLIPARILGGIHPSIIAIPHEQLFPAPDSFAAVREELFKPWRAIEELDALGARVFNFPSKRPSEQIAEVMSTVCEPLLKKKQAFAPIPETRFEKLCGPFAWSPDLRMAMLDLRGALDKTSRTSSSYRKHRIFMNRKYDKLFNQITAVSGDPG